MKMMERRKICTLVSFLFTFRSLFVLDPKNGENNISFQEWNRMNLMKKGAGQDETRRKDEEVEEEKAIEDEMRCKKEKLSMDTEFG